MNAPIVLALSFRALLTLSVIEILLLVLVLAIYLVAVVSRLRSISDNLGKVAFGVRAVEVQTNNIGPSVQRLNGLMREINGALAGIAEKAERHAAGQR